jgi:hypothetical protein
LIEQYCIKSESEDPLEMAITLMKNPNVKMHGPEHHFLVPAVLLASYYNLINDDQKKAEKIREARNRAGNLLGGYCGYYGACAAGVGTGVFVSLITGATPLSKHEWKLSNMMTSQSLCSIADVGGPRCCKRTTFLSIIEAVDFLNGNFGVEMNVNRDLKCEFSSLNRECLRDECRFYSRD